MLSQPDVTIIIPAYNLEKYIGATLESVLLQKDISLEVLVIDDNSTDKTTDIVNCYATQFPFIKLMTNENSKGVGGARNTALKHMQGKMCFFLDGDDLLFPQALAPLITYMRQNNTPVVRGMMTHLCHQRWLYIAPSPSSPPEGEYPSAGFTQYLYDAQFIKKHNCFFPEDCSKGEDLVFFCQIFCKITSIPYIHHYMYLYRINHKKNTPSAKHALSYIQHFVYIQQFLKKAHKEEFLLSYMRIHFYSFWLLYAYNASQIDSKTLHEYLYICATLLSEQEELLTPLLAPQLKEQSQLFWQACKKHDTHTMLTAIQNTGLLRPSDSYIGIKEEQLTKNWKWYRLLHRIKNTLATPISIKYMWYAHMLAQKAKKRLKK